MKKHFFPALLLFSIFAFSSFQVLAETINAPIIGEWVYEVSDAPEGYEKGSLIFSEKDGQTVCIVKLEAGELETSDLKIVEGKITFTALVDGNPVNVELNQQENKLIGTVDSADGPKTITAIKKE